MRGRMSMRRRRRSGTGNVKRTGPMVAVGVDEWDKELDEAGGGALAGLGSAGWWVAVQGGKQPAYGLWSCAQPAGCRYCY